MSYLSVLSAMLGSVLCAVLSFSPATAASERSASELMDDLRSGGYVIVFRHGATVSTQSNMDSMSRKNVPAQRQLNEEGRAQAKSTGESMRKLKIPVARVFSSTIQRAIDTATLLGFGEVTATADLAESGPEASADEANRRALALRGLVAQRPPADNNVVIVTHKPNIVDAFGKDWSDIGEGEASVFQPDGKGGYSFVVRIKAGSWSELARTAS